MDATDIERRDAALAASIEDFISRMWLTAERPGSEGVGKFYVEDLSFEIEGLASVHGQDGLRNLGGFRASLGERHSRHLMTNYTFDFSALEKTGKATVKAMMTHIGGSGVRPLPMEPPLALYDVTLLLQRQSQGGWLIERQYMNPVFLSKSHPSIGQPLDHAPASKA